MAQLREEIYDENGLVEVRFIEVPDVSVEDQVLQKEQELIAIYNEIQKLKQN